ncbi:YkgJ family cysteine cluster protein [bacterium]|nr:MAG: YkgJ family cysteine cluster protein [bacterium]RIK61557.1 MAG: zinc/iron-chelating domain-containing protein [Planctomycetota bacterium]
MDFSRRRACYAGPMPSTEQTAPTPDWFEGGVHFRCKGPECGDCCSGKRGPGAVWVNLTEMQQLADVMKLTLDQFTRRYVRRMGRGYSLIERANNDCIFYLPEKGCAVYEARPTQCRTYPFWGRIMAARETWEQEARQCPGINADETLVSADEVRRQLRVDGGRH